MADDTPTVEQAIKALNAAIADYGIACVNEETGSSLVSDLDAKIDALITAVRAEQTVTASTGKPGTVGEHLTSGNAKKER